MGDSIDAREYDGVTIQYCRGSDGGFLLTRGTKVFLCTGEEVKGISAIGMPTKDVDGVLEVTLTLAVKDVKVV